MHYLSFYTLFILIIVVIINAHAPLPTKSFPDADHVSRKNARESPHHHHYDEATWESDDDYDTDDNGI
ncbi:hypothetical protein I4U23_021415 [Adineta vaga]|nr:hypothetical protein I4U23_021415 [Adineta vaga]